MTHRQARELAALIYRRHQLLACAIPEDKREWAVVVACTSGATITLRSLQDLDRAQLEIPS